MLDRAFFHDARARALSSCDARTYITIDVDFVPKSFLLHRNTATLCAAVVRPPRSRLKCSAMFVRFRVGELEVPRVTFYLFSEKFQVVADSACATLTRRGVSGMSTGHQRGRCNSHGWAIDRLRALPTSSPQRWD